MVNWTVGTGGDYTTWYAAWLALYALSPLADDYTITQISNCSMGNWPTNASIINSNGKTVQFINGSPCYGNPNRGYQTNTSGNYGMYLNFGSDTNQFTNYYGKVIVEGLKIIGTTPSASNADDGFGIRIRCKSLDGSKINGCLVVGTYRGIKTHTNNEAYIQLINCKVAGCSDWGIGYDGGWRDQTLQTRNRLYYENVTIYDCGNPPTAGINCGVKLGGTAESLAYGAGYIHMTNVVSAGNYVDWSDSSAIYDNFQFVTFNSCADSDGTLPTHTGRVRNIVAANEFESLVSTDDNFLKLPVGGTKYLDTLVVPFKGKAPMRAKFTPSVAFAYGSGGVLGYSGSAPTYATTDIEGYERPGDDGLYSIGAHEAQFEWRLD